MSHTQLHLNTTLIGRTSGQSLKKLPTKATGEMDGTFEQNSEKII
jgi:hypothetical protein